MKAETVLYTYLTQVFTSESDDRENIISAMQAYARIQIEKDRERVRQESKKYLFTTSNGLETIHKETPINLD